MHKKEIKLIKNLVSIQKEIFSTEFINKISKKTNFVKRKSKLTAKDFMSFCIFLSEDMCTSSLSKLCTRLDSKTGVSISQEALNKRFNENSVQFMKALFNEILIKQNKILSQEKRTLETNFKRIILTDSTQFPLPREFVDTYKGLGGIGSSSAVKIQLQYELLSGQFIHCEIQDATKNDAEYIDIMRKDIKEKDLRLSDLGYFKKEYLEYIDENNAYYISKIKSNTSVFIDNPTPQKYSNGNIKKSTLYKKVDIESLVEHLADGQTIELSDIYIKKNKKSKTRLIITKLSKENKIKRQKKHELEISRNRGTKNKSAVWYSINAYITNVPANILGKEKIHDIYSLRWQIELMFKIWKSLFKIHMVKKIKIERFECFLYGRLIALLLSSSIVFTARETLYIEKEKELSEIKAFGIVTEYFDSVRERFFKGEIAITNILNKIINSIKRFGIKSKRKGKKTALFILKDIELKIDELENLAS